MLNTLTSLTRRTRQHHGLEHATLHMLAARIPGLRMAGLSDPFGFTLYGEADEAQVQRAVSDAMLRLQAGESGLAIHPNCGTNLAATSLLAGAGALLARVGARNPLDIFVRTIMAVMAAVVLSKPLGRRLQVYTTSGNLAGRWLVGVRTRRLGPLVFHRVVLD
jgi:hypothetical protein